MKKAAPLSKASTQKFTEVKDISDSFVLFTDSTAVSVVQVNATNFSLQSQIEQESKIASYASFLNSLSFSIQILIRSHKLDISSYLASLEIQSNQAKDQNISLFIKNYKSFVEELLKTRTVLDKKFYIIIPYSPLEKGITGAQSAVTGKTSDAGLLEISAVLRSKTETVLTQMKRVGLSAKVLSKEELTSLFHDLYNENVGTDAAHEVHSPMVLGKI